MSYERRNEIYTTRKLARRLRMVLKIYPQMTQQEIRDSVGHYITGERLMTVEDLVDKILNEKIQTDYPLVLEMEREISRRSGMSNPFHRWLISQRKWCEHEGCRMKLERAVKVIKRHGHEIVVCRWHSYGPIEQGLRERGTLEAKPIANKE